MEETGRKEARPAADHVGVEFVHSCSFCGWARSSGSPVVLPAGCPECGCPVDSATQAEADLRRLLAPAEVPAFRAPAALRMVVWAFALCFALAAARVGYSLA